MNALSGARARGVGCGQSERVEHGARRMPRMQHQHNRRLLVNLRTWRRQHIPQDWCQISPAVRRRVPIPLQQPSQRRHLRRSDQRMLKHSRTLLVWACFVLVLASFVLIGTFSPSYQKCTADHENYDGQNKQDYLHQTVVNGPHLPLFFVCEGAATDENSGTLTVIATIAIAGSF